MDTKGYDVIHTVIRGRDRGEDAAHESIFCRERDSGKPEMGAGVVGGFVGRVRRIPNDCAVEVAKERRWERETADGAERRRIHGE